MHKFKKLLFTVIWEDLINLKNSSNMLPPLPEENLKLQITESVESFVHKSLYHGHDLLLFP